MVGGEPVGLLVGRMPVWANAQSVTSWWGGVYPSREAPWMLAVVDPGVSLTDASSRSAATANWVDRAFQRRVSAVAAIVAAVLGVGILAAATVSPFWLRLPVDVVGGVLCAAAVTAALSWWKRGRAKPPTGVRWRAGMDAALWNLVRHLNSYRHADADTTDAVRQLLWALAHTDHGTPQHDALISELTNDFGGWDEHASADLRRAASRVWAVCGR